MKSYLNFERSGIPEHTEAALERYFVHGHEPGSFLRSMLEGNLYGAIGRADAQNRIAFADIAQWIARCAPADSYGGPAIVRCWIDDIHNVRTDWVKAQEKKVVWETLSK